MPKKKKKSEPSKKRKVAYNSKQLTQHLRELAAEVETIDDDGATVTKGEALAKLLWKKGLGYIVKDKKTGEVTYHKPESWAIQLIYERMEGKAPMAIPEDKDRQTAAKKVSELARSRINSLSEAAIAVSDQTSSMDGPDHGAQGSEEPDKES